MSGRVVVPRWPVLVGRGRVRIMSAADEQTADAVVIGLGPGGEALAGDLAEAGLDVVGVEARLIGGECAYWGCVPTKMMLRGAEVLAEARRVPQLAGTAEVTADWAPVAGRVREEATTGWDDAAAAERVEGKGVRLLRGTARLTSPTSVTVAVDGGERHDVTARRAVVVAAGSKASVPPLDGLADTPYWTNHEFVEAAQLPESLVVLGGGAVGCELAQVAARFGVRVSIVEQGPRLLGPEEPEAGDLLADVFTREGVELHLGVGARAVSYDDGFRLELDDGTTVRGERLLVATGRHVDLDGLGAASIGIDPGGKALPVDGHCHVVAGGEPLPRTFALGDVTGQGPFTHVAVHQARVVRDVVLGRDVPADLGTVDRLPRVTFTDPEIGAVGLTAAQARDRWGDAVTVVQQPLAEASARAWMHGPGNDGLLMLVAHDGVLVGATSAGPHGGEVLGALSVAVQARVPVRDLARQVWAYPTLHRGVDALLGELTG